MALSLLSNPLVVSVPLFGSPQPVDFTFCRIPAGSFLMGQRGVYPQEEPVHLVTIEQDFYLGTTPVTQRQYRALFYLGWESLFGVEGNRGEDPSEFKGADRPVEQVNWDEAFSVAKALTASGLLPAGFVASLPAEAEWEYACRAGSQTEYWNCDGDTALGEIGWYGQNAGGETHPVAQKAANPWGLYDLHGNVAEWCLDYYDPFRYRKEVEGRTGDAFMNREHIELGERNPTVLAIHEMLQRFVSGDRKVREVDKATLKSYRVVAQQFTDNQAAGWGEDASAIDAALKLGEWPEAAISIASGTLGWSENYLKGEANPADPARVLRGGSWGSAAAGCRSAYRLRYAPGNRNGSVGVRLAVVPVRSRQEQES